MAYGDEHVRKLMIARFLVEDLSDCSDIKLACSWDLKEDLTSSRASGVDFGHEYANSYHGSHGHLECLKISVFRISRRGVVGLL